MPDNRRIPIAKLLAAMAVGMAVGFGTCSFAALNSGSGNSISSAFIGLGAILFFVCLAGIVITTLIFLVSKIVEVFRR